MKKKKFARVMISLLTLTTFFVACGGDDPSDSDNNGGGSSSGGTSIMTSEQQKSKMETTAKEFMSYIKASNFQNVVDIAKYANETYNDDNYNSDAVDGWWSDCLDAITELNSASGYSKNYIRLYIASNFVGHFNANTSTKKWEYTSASDLQFTFKDKSGNTCTATLTTSGEKKKVYVGDSFDYHWDNYTSGTDEYKNYIMVPENINVTFTQNGTTIASIVVTTDLSGMSSVDYDLSKDSYSATCKMTVNDYTFNASKVAYSPSSASVSLTVSKGSKTLISMSVSANSSVTNDQVEEGNISNVGTVNINMDILGELQVKGTCSSCSKFQTYMEKADANDNDESTYKSYILQANSLLDLGLYYDNSNTKQASVFLEPFQQDDYYDRNWYCEPVLKFSDGTTYSTFEAFFDETSFQDVIDKFNALIDEYKDMVD